MRCVCHTNSEYRDVLDIFLSRYDKYCSLPLTIITNEMIEGRDCFVYESNTSYKDRWISFLNNVDEDICLLHEDFILYETANIPSLPNQFDCVRLQKNGRLEFKHIESNLYEIVGDCDRFSITPSIWKSKSLLLFLLSCKANSIWDLEILEQHNTANLKIGFVYSDEVCVGIYHHRSIFFPCILSAISKGKWNYSEYRSELECVFDEYSIDMNKRGLI